MKVFSYILLLIFPVIIFVVSIFTYLNAMQLPIQESRVNGELLKITQNMILSTAKNLGFIALAQLWAAGFIAYVIYTLKYQKEQEE